MGTKALQLWLLVLVLCMIILPLTGLFELLWLSVPITALMAVSIFFLLKLSKQQDKENKTED